MTHDHPLRDREQDAINAILMSEIDASSVFVLPEWEGDLRGRPMVLAGSNADETRLVCLNKGRPISILHHCNGPKV